MPGLSTRGLPLSFRVAAQMHVGGNTLGMERLRAVLAEVGFTGVRTYVHSGNVLFSAKGDAGSPVRDDRKEARR